MTPAIPRKLLYLLVLVVLAAAIATVYIRHVMESRSLTVYFENAAAVTVVDSGGSEEIGPTIELARIEKSGDTVRIPKKASAMVTYKGTEGYRDGFENASGATVTLDPDYSDKKIAEIIASQKDKIRTAIFSHIQNGGSYTLEQGTLFDHGSWYISRLVPPDNPDDPVDTLQVLLKNNGSSWEMIEAPMLVFTKYNTKNIPVEVLDAANTYRGDF